MPDRDIEILPRREDISTPSSKAVYIIVDVYCFSSSVVQLLVNGATHVQPADSETAARAYTDTYEDAVVGGEPGAVTPSDGSDIINSPTQIATVDVTGHPVSLYSSNGAQSVTSAAAADEVFVASTVNAQAVAETVAADTTGPIRIVAAGNKGVVRHEDIVGAMLVRDHLLPAPVTEAERAVYTAALREIYRANEWDAQRKIADGEWTTQLDAFDVVPRLTADGVLVAAEGHDPAAN